MLTRALPGEALDDKGERLAAALRITKDALGRFQHHLGSPGLEYAVRTLLREPIDQFVVPYSPLLTARYNAHINVEAVMSVATCKYLFKYVTKGQAAPSRFQGNKIGN